MRMINIKHFLAMVNMCCVVCREVDKVTTFKFRGLRTARILEPNMVLTIEPGKKYYIRSKILYPVV